MGFFKDLVGIAAPIAGSFLGGPIGGAIGGALGGAVSGSGQPKSTTSSESGTQNGTQNSTQSSTSTNTLDPRIAQLLGMNGGGVLGGLESLLGNGGNSLSGQSNSFLNSNAGQILNNGYAGTNALTSSQYDAPAMQAAQVRAPSQNGMDLSGAYDRFINGTPGANPHLDQQISGAIGMNRLGFQQMQDDSNENLLENVLPSIRGGAIAAGQYGGSRQGIAEGNAIGQQQKELARATSMFGQNATNAAVGAKANAYESDSNRALSATQGLGAQQYGVAQQDASMRQAADNTNIQALMGTRGQNSSNLATGIGLQQGLLGTAAGYSNADVGRLGAISGILQPFLGAGATTSNSGTSNSTTNNETTGNVSQPLYSSNAGAALGGGLLGAQLGGMFGGGGSSTQFPGQKMGGFGDLVGWNGAGGLFGKNSFF